MSEYLSCAETAKLVRNVLKKAFPKVKFSVRSDTYSGGASIDVAWTDGPLSKEVERVAKQFESSHFDGMIDMKQNYTSWLLPDGSAIVATDHGTEYTRGVIPPTHNAKPHPDAKLVSFGADFVFCSRRIS